MTMTDKAATILVCTRRPATAPWTHARHSLRHHRHHASDEHAPNGHRLAVPVRNNGL